jgi:CRP-like cAMP-binding protein
MDVRGIGGRILYYEDGEVIFEEDSIGDEMYIIESGKVEINQRISGRKTTIAVLGDGDFFGEMAMFTDEPRSASAVAVGKATLMSFPMEEVLQRMQSNPQFTITLLQTLINRLRSTTSTLRTLIARMYESGGEFTGDMFPEKPSLKIGEILMEMGCLTKLQLERSLLKQKEADILGRGHKLLGEVMVESGVITEEELLNALSEQRTRLHHESD